MTDATLLPDSLPRDMHAIPCLCNGFAGKVDATPDEDDKYGCGRPRCCCAAFVCRRCTKRFVARLEAPEYSDD